MVPDPSDYGPAGRPSADRLPEVSALRKTCPFSSVTGLERGTRPRLHRARRERRARGAQPGLDRIPIDEHIERVLIAAACRVDNGRQRPTSEKASETRGTRRRSVHPVSERASPLPGRGSSVPGEEGEGEQAHHVRGLIRSGYSKGLDELEPPVGLLHESRANSSKSGTISVPRSALDVSWTAGWRGALNHSRRQSASTDRRGRKTAACLLRSVHAPRIDRRWRTSSPRAWSGRTAPVVPTGDMLPRSSLLVTLRRTSGRWVNMPSLL